MTMKTAQEIERRQFAVHPKILLTLMREQAGSLQKALAELVMNSVDAGAKRIELNFTPEGFTLSDDGKGFSTREQLEESFDTFGKPHDEADTPHYGRFRVGRGQIMSYAKTIWRSGPFEMHVDMNSKLGESGYDLIVHSQETHGCTIAGTYYDPDKSSNEYHVEYGYIASLRKLVRFVPIPIYLDGLSFNTLPSTFDWDLEDEFAWYKFDKDDYKLRIYNKGVFVRDHDVSEFGFGGYVVSKQALLVNLARNAIRVGECTVWRSICEALRERFALRVNRGKKLSVEEGANLLNELMFGDLSIGHYDREALLNIKFIPDINGQYQSLASVFSSGFLTIFDGNHKMIAERVQKSGRAYVIMESMFYQTRLEPRTPENMANALFKIYDRLFVNVRYSGRVRELVMLDFEGLVQEMDGTHEILDDTSLEEEQKVVLNCLREINDQAAVLFESRKIRRKLVAGKSDQASAWTDGVSYIAINVRRLWAMRDNHALRLIALLAHEYTHNDPSSVDHDHDYEFYTRFHDALLDHETATLINDLQRKYMARICKAGIVPGKYFKYQVNYLVNWAPKLATRLKNKLAA